MNDMRSDLYTNKKLGIRNAVLSFVIPFFIMYIAVVVMKVTPYGEHSFAIVDGSVYLNDVLNHARMLRGQENFLYSFTGLGFNNWANLAWGGFNPVKLLSLFATIDTVVDWFTWISLVNMSVCGLTMYLMLSGIYGHKASHLLFSTSYAMMGFNVANCFQMLFFIGPQMLPLVVVGLLRLLKGKSPLLYILSLFFCIFCNFYFGLMLCIASVVIFITYNYIYNDVVKSRRKKLLITYGISSLIAGLMASFFWLPALKAFSGGGRLNQTSAAEYQFSENMPFIQIFSKLFTGANSAHEEMVGFPNIFCGILVVALVVLFFMNKNISKRLKTGTAAVLTLYLLTFYIKAFTLAMHGFTHTNWFPYRYSYVFSFFLIWIATEQFRYIRETELSSVKRCFMVILLAALVVFSTSYEFISGGEVLIDFGLLALIGLLFYRWKKKPESFHRRIGAVALMLLVAVNLFANYIFSIQKLQNEDRWELNLKDYQQNTLLSGALVDGINNFDKGFFRMEKGVSESGSGGADAFLYDYNGISLSGPNIRAFVHKQMNKIGVNWYDMRHWYSDGISAATDSLLGIKYILTEQDLEAEKGYELLVNIGKGAAYQNPYALSVAVLADARIDEIALGSDAFENLNQIWKSMAGGNQDIFTRENNITFTFHNTIDGESITSEELVTSVSKTSAALEASRNGLSFSDNDTKSQKPDTSYIECRFIAQQDGPVYYFDKSVPESESGRPTTCVACIGVFHKGEEVVHYFNVDNNMASQKLIEQCNSILLAYTDNEVLQEYAEKLNSRDITLDVEHENDLTGTFTAGERQRILFSIPWDEGWTCYIDGQKVDIDKTWDLFMSVEAPEGQHTYEMKFFPAWMNYGLIISSISFAGLIIFMVVWKKRKKEEAGIEQGLIVSDASSSDEDAVVTKTDRDSVEQIQEEGVI